MTITAEIPTTTPVTDDTVLYEETSRQVRDCHRCGWRLEVIRVGRRDRRILGLNRGERWVCADCIADLVPLRLDLDEGGVPDVERFGPPVADRSVA